MREEQAVALAVAVAVGMEPGGRDPLDELMARPELLAGLLVLDNCEHLLRRLRDRHLRTARRCT